MIEIRDKLDIEFIHSNFKILIVEDSKTVNKIITTELVKLGYNCFQAYNIKDAKDFISKHNFNFIILDINLPDGNGFEIIKQLENSSEKIFVLTNDKDKQLREISYQKGVIDFIIKDKMFIDKINQIGKSIELLEKNRLKTILVLDDSFVIREQISDIFTNRFYNIKTASNTQEALEIISTTPIDLLILDIELNNENGLEFLEKHKLTIIRKYTIPVIILSGYIDNQVTSNSLKAGASDVIKKPYVIEELILKVNLWIDYKRKDKEIKLINENLKNIINQEVEKINNNNYICFNKLV